MADLTDRVVAEWPAVLAVGVLVLGHLALSMEQGDPLRPLGIPLFAAMVVFLGGELLRRLV